MLQQDLAAKSCHLHNFVIWSRSLKLFHRNDHHIETIKCLACVQNLFGEHHPVRPAHVISYGLPIHETSVQALACPVWWFGYGLVLWTIPLCSSIKKWSPYWADVSRARFRSLPWRLRSQHDFAAKSCPPHNLVIWSLVLQLWNSNDHHIELTCRAQHLGRYLKGQGHSMTLQQNCLWPITLLFEVGFHNYLTKWSLYWDDVSLPCQLFGSVLTILQYTKYYYLNSKFQWSTRSILFFVIIFFI